MRHMKLFVILSTALALAGTAAAATPIYWAPAKMARALTALQYPHAGTLGGRCTGIGKPVRGGYTGFRCVMVWQIEGLNSTDSGTVAAYARPMVKGRVCGSTVSLRGCRPLAPGPLAGDPTICSVDRPTPAQKAHDCAQSSAKAAVVAKHGQGTANLICTEQQDIYHWSCTSLSGPFTVTFTKAVSQWTTTVTP